MTDESVVRPWIEDGKLCGSVETTADEITLSMIFDIPRRLAGAPPVNSELIAFLRARLGEREAKAHAAKPGPWRRDYHAAFMHNITAADGTSLITGGLMGSPDVSHIVDNDPAFVLADVAAKRQIIGEYEKEAWVVEQGHQSAWTEGGQAARETVLKLLALPFSGHPDYREEWKP